MTESVTEKKVCRYAKSQGWLVYKFQSPSNRGVPDRMFMRHGVLIFIEFKSPGKRPTNQQHATHERIRDHGFPVFIVDEPQQGIDLLAGLSS